MLDTGRILDQLQRNSFVFAIYMCESCSDLHMPFELLKELLPTKSV